MLHSPVSNPWPLVYLLGKENKLRFSDSQCHCPGSPSLFLFYYLYFFLSKVAVCRIKWQLATQTPGINGRVRFFGTCIWLPWTACVLVFLKISSGVMFINVEMLSALCENIQCFHTDTAVSGLLAVSPANPPVPFCRNMADSAERGPRQIREQCFGYISVRLHVVLYVHLS